jgi:hypothetical protein
MREERENLVLSRDVAVMLPITAAAMPTSKYLIILDFSMAHHATPPVELIDTVKAFDTT